MGITKGSKLTQVGFHFVISAGELKTTRSPGCTWESYSKRHPSTWDIIGFALDVDWMFKSGDPSLR